MRLRCRAGSGSAEKSKKKPRPGKGFCALTARTVALRKTRGEGGTMKHRHRQEDILIYVKPVRLKGIANEASLWYESPHETRVALGRATRHEKRLEWVRLEMAQRLDPDERLYLDLHYFQGVTIREIGERAGVHPASVYRVIREAIRKLRKAAREQKLMHRRRPRR
jgi:RNA polymerase sigma factor (sigma-70 family)